MYAIFVALIIAIIDVILTICVIFVFQFPPKMMIRAYKSFNRTCREESQVTQESVNKFNDGEDFNALPDDRPLKCYMYILLINPKFRQI